MMNIRWGFDRNLVIFESLVELPRFLLVHDSLTQYVSLSQRACTDVKLLLLV